MNLLAWLLLLLIPSVYSYVVQIDDGCRANTAQAFNEVRFIAGLLDRTLGVYYKETDQADSDGIWQKHVDKNYDFEYLDDVFKKFLGFGLDDKANVGLFRERLKSLAAMARSNDESKADWRITCENMLDFVPVDDALRAKVPDSWASTDQTWMNARFRHAYTQELILGSALHCRINDKAYTAMVFFPINKANKPWMDLCDFITDESRPAITRQVANPKANPSLADLDIVPQRRMLVDVLAHEHIHLPIGAGTVGKRTLAAGDIPDQHPANNVVTSGYYTKKESSFLGSRLASAENTLFNPDSYAMVLLLFRLRTKFWKAEEKTENGNKLPYRYYWAGADDKKPWTGDEWPTDKAPNWTDEETPV